MNRFTLFIITALCILFLGACNNAQSDKESKQTVKIKTSYEFKDKNKDHNRGEMKHETIEVPVNPKRVVVMDYGALDVMQQLKLENRINDVIKNSKAIKNNDNNKRNCNVNCYNSFYKYLSFFSVIFDFVLWYSSTFSNLFFGFFLSTFTSPISRRIPY